MRACLPFVKVSIAECSARMKSEISCNENGMKYSAPLESSGERLNNWRKNGERETKLKPVM